MSTPPQGSQGQGDSHPLRQPLLVNLENRSENPNIDARIVNGYIERDGQNEAWVYKRPTFTSFQISPGGPAQGRGIYNWLGEIYTIWGGFIYKNNALLGAVANAGWYSFSATLGATPSLFFQNGTSFYSYNTSTGVIVVTPGSFTAVQEGNVYLDGTTYLMDSLGNIWGSNINDPTLWPATNVIKAQIEPDLGVKLAKQLVYVVAFKNYSTEMFYDAGNATGSPLGAVPGQKLNYGCRHFQTVAELAGMLLWVDQIAEGGMSVRVMDQLTAQPCSTPQVERLLQYADANSYFSGFVYSWTAKIDGHMFYVLTIEDFGFSLVYDLTQKFWYQWTSPSGGYIPIVASTFLNGQTLCQGESSGIVYKLTTQTGTDDGAIITTDIYTPEFDGGTRKRKTINRMKFIADNQPGNVLQVRVSDDDYHSFSNFRTVDCGLNDPYLDNCGTFRRRVWHIRQAMPYGGRIIKAIELEAEVGDL